MYTGCPIPELLKHYPAAEFEPPYRICGPEHAPVFEAIVRNVSGQEFIALGTTKKAAKAKAALKALEYVHSIQGKVIPGVISISDISDDQAADYKILASKIAALAKEKLVELVRGLPNSEVYKTIIAAIIMMNGSQGEVVAMGTGTNCISGKNLDRMGTVVNDCHAEVIARRALMQFLYSQLDLCARLLFII